VIEQQWEQYNMPDDTNDKGTSTEDSEVIKEMRVKLKAAEAKAKTAADDARKEIVREAEAINLLGDQFKGLATYMSQEVEGELTRETADKWLADRGLAVSPEASNDSGATETEVDAATKLESVSNLGSKVAATATVTPDQEINTSISNAADDFKNIGDMPALTAKLAGILAE